MMYRCPASLFQPRRERRGHTLSEVMISMALLSILLVACTQIVIYSLRFYRQQELRIRPLQAGRTTLLNLMRDVRSSSEILEPGLSQLATGLDYLVFRQQTADGPRVVAYRLMRDKHEIEQRLYGPDYIVGNEESQVLVAPPRTLATDVKDLRCWEAPNRPGLMYITLEPTGQDQKRVVLKSAAFRRL